MRREKNVKKIWANISVHWAAIALLNPNDATVEINNYPWFVKHTNIIVWIHNSDAGSGLKQFISSFENVRYLNRLMCTVRYTAMILNIPSLVRGYAYSRVTHYWMCETDTLLHHNVDLLRCLFWLIISFFYLFFLIFSLSLPHSPISLSLSPFPFALTVASNFFSAEILRWNYLYHNLYLGWLVPSLSSGV